ncbi:MAG: aminoglycoside phosphotransferase family protein [Bacteroidales bacterium]|nr:aminoglycoside phosphotransferase family protein [Bacteroidales bacterium]
MEAVKERVLKFAIEGEIKEIRPLGNGLINDTFKVVTAGEGPDYVLQCVNHAIFKDVDLLQSNIEAVTAHIRTKLEAAGEKDLDRKVLRFIPLKDSPKTYYFDGEKYWRVSVFIKDAFTFETVNPEYSYYAGKAFGNFEAMLADIPAKLGETIPDFHNMELRSRQLKEAIAADPVGRMADPEVQAIAAEIAEYDFEMCKAERMYREGVLPKRICHCDTKVNNMMFDAEGNVLCVIDLDTVMPSFVFSDFGDFLRTAANTVAEDDPAVDKVAFRMDIFEAFAKGYIESASCFLTPVERENLPYGALLFPYMQAVRFFADYINGDTYYKIKYPEHNLVRTRNQLALFRSAKSHMAEMASFIQSL